MISSSLVSSGSESTERRRVFPHDVRQIGRVVDQHELRVILSKRCRLRKVRSVRGSRRCGARSSVTQIGQSAGRRSCASAATGCPCRRDRPGFGRPARPARRHCRPHVQRAVEACRAASRTSGEGVILLERVDRDARVPEAQQTAHFLAIGHSNPLLSDSNALSAVTSATIHVGWATMRACRGDRGDDGGARLPRGVARDITAVGQPDRRSTSMAG
jgi:hypothetical protein